MVLHTTDGGLGFAARLIADKVFGKSCSRDIADLKAWQAGCKLVSALVGQGIRNLSNLPFLE